MAGCWRSMPGPAGSCGASWTIDPKDERYITGPPLTFKDKVLIGHAGADVGPVRGYVTAYDSATGKEAWRVLHRARRPEEGF